MTTMTTKTTVTRVNVYRSAGAWCYAAWCGDEYDHSDVLDVEDPCEAAAIEAAYAMFPRADVRRVDDVR